MIHIRYTPRKNCYYYVYYVAHLRNTLLSFFNRTYVLPCIRQHSDAKSANRNCQFIRTELLTCMCSKCDHISSSGLKTFRSSGKKRIPEIFLLIQFAPMLNIEALFSRSNERDIANKSHNENFNGKKSISKINRN